MKACLNFGEIISAGQPQVEEMQRIGDAYASADEAGACEAVTRQVAIVEAVLIQTYGIAAMMSRKAEDLSEVAEVWGAMSRFCQSTLVKLSSLRIKYPYCGTPALYDKTVDYKLACDKRYRGAMEELACQKMEFPKGLLREMK